MTTTSTSNMLLEMNSNTKGTSIVSSTREESGLAALEVLSLDELGAIAAREIGEGLQLQAEAVGLSRRSTSAFYRAGRTLWCARKKLKGKGKRGWTRWQKANGIPTTSAWQAIRLYEEAEGEEAVAGLTRTQALKKYGITKPKKDRPQAVPVEGDRAVVEDAEPVKMGGVAAVGGVSPESPDLRLTPARDGEADGTAPGHDADAGLGGHADRPHADSTVPPAAETLLHVVRRLEILERDIQGDRLDDEARSLIDQAIVTLRRLKGDVASATEAA